MGITFHLKVDSIVELFDVLDEEVLANAIVVVMVEELLHFHDLAVFVGRGRTALLITAQEGVLVALLVDAD